MKKLVIGLLVALMGSVSAFQYEWDVQSVSITRGVYTTHIVPGEYNEDNDLWGVQVGLYEDSFRGVSYGIEYANFINSYGNSSWAAGVYGTIEWTSLGILSFESDFSVGMVKGYTNEEIKIPLFITKDQMIFGSHTFKVVAADTFVIGVRSFGGAKSVEIGVRF